MHAVFQQIGQITLTMGKSAKKNQKQQNRPNKTLNPFYIDQGNGNGSHDAWDDYVDYDNDEEELGLLGHDVHGSVYRNNSQDQQYHHSRHSAPVLFGRRFFLVLGIVALLIIVLVSLGGESNQLIPT